MFAISYDPVEQQRAFAEACGITYSLLSDADQKMIEATGLLNDLVYADSKPELHFAKVAPGPVEPVRAR